MGLIPVPRYHLESDLERGTLVSVLPDFPPLADTGLAALPQNRALSPRVNFNHIPVNAPKCPFLSYHRDGRMRIDGNLGRTLTFNPNSDGLWDNQPDFAELPMLVDGDGAHWDHRVDDDHWEQSGNLFRLVTPSQQQALFENTPRAMGDARLHIKERHVANCLRADPAYSEGVARALGLSIREAAE